MKYTGILILVFISCGVFSQQDSLPVTQIHKRYVAWFSPSKATHVYGVMFNVWAKNDQDTSIRYPKIYGAELNINPAGVFAPFLTAFYSLNIPQLMKNFSENPDSVDFNTFKKINGLQLGLANYEPTIINGLDINAANSFDSVTNGVTISAVSNTHYSVNGVTVASIGNVDDECNGLQIALFNSCKKLKGVQLGLWNKNQKRSLPFMNWSFKS